MAPGTTQSWLAKDAHNASAANEVGRLTPIIRSAGGGHRCTGAVGPLGLSSGEGYHEPRYFYASLLIRHGESVKVVQEPLWAYFGSDDPDVYSHLWPDSDDSTRATVDLVLGDGGVSDSCQTVGR